MKKARPEVSSVRAPAATQLTWRAWVCWVTGPLGTAKYRLTARWVPGCTPRTTGSEATPRPAGMATARRPANDRARAVPGTMSAPRLCDGDRGRGDPHRLGSEGVGEADADHGAVGTGGDDLAHRLVGEAAL